MLVVETRTVGYPLEPSPFSRASLYPKDIVTYKNGILGWFSLKAKDFITLGISPDLDDRVVFDLHIIG